MSYTHYWEWKTAIADANRFAAWSRDVAHLQKSMATPGKLLPWEVPIIGKLVPSALELDLRLPQHEAMLKALQREQALDPLHQPIHPVFVGFNSAHEPIFVVPLQEPQPFTSLLICGPDGTGESIFTPTEVAFNGDESANDAGEPFRITFDHLQAPYEDGCTTNLNAYDILVRCALVRLAHYFPSVRVFSDGGKSVLKIPVAICRYIFEDETAFPLWTYDDDDENA